ANVAKFSIIGRRVDRILCPAANIAEGVNRRFGDAKKVSVFPNTIDPRAFPNLSRAQRDEFRRELGLPEGAPGLLHFGRHWYLKDGDIFLDALAVLVG